MLVLSALFTALLAASSVSAHATFQDLWVNGVDKQGTCVRQPLNNNPVERVNIPDIACNANARAAPGTCKVAAGDTVTVEMHQQPGDRSCSTEAIGGNHDGPVIVYMARVDNAATAVGSNANWFKIGQTGLVSTDYWGTDVLNKNCGKMDFKIPSDIAPGQYLLRAEVIALHVAGNVNGAQFYISCFQLEVTGSGNAGPPTVKFPGAYSPQDPGILFNLYGSYTTYTIPGPPVYTGGGSPAPPIPTTPTPTGPAPTPTPTPSPVGTVPQYGQCGGIGWTGGTACIGNFKCTVINDYYSQCL
ncbi:glycosyl hydrolase family 61-domain-containing protein [Cristinia sonorae]|uniref:AA9 family lytic polysaccharide monooxygenase n=1 Tax=Cristinia sonorae TaxID=1940300 RepID=A0A8K0XSG1_9AGAR|nr:glycosyl hydrolase family 61-domain-containing protein [Cristinia sonorae]